MAFPTSGLSNNQVHKEGNRTFVYDSALGVWDQVRETDKSEISYNITDGEIGQNVSVTLGSKTVFPTGHVIKLSEKRQNTGTSISAASGTSYDNDTDDLDFTATAGNKIVCWITGGRVTSGATFWAACGMRIYDEGVAHDYINGPHSYEVDEHGGGYCHGVHTVQGTAGSIRSLKLKRAVWNKEGGGTITWYNAESRYTAYTVMEVQV